MIMPSEEEGFPPEEGYIPDLAAILSSPDVHGLVGELAVARAEVARLEGELAVLRERVRGLMKDWRLVAGLPAAGTLAQHEAFARLDEAAGEWT